MGGERGGCLVLAAMRWVVLCQLWVVVLKALARALHVFARVIPIPSPSHHPLPRTTIHLSFVYGLFVGQFFIYRQCKYRSPGGCGCGCEEGKGKGMGTIVIEAVEVIFSFSLCSG